MRIEIRKGTVPQMASWLKSARDTGVRDEAELRRILSLPDYQVEYARYGDPNLPTCGITPEESVDFFLHFDEKSFGKHGKYPGSSYCVDEQSWAFFEEQHRELICRALSDGEKARDMDFDQVRQLVGKYETFTFTSLKNGETRLVQQYPTYYIGCCLWGKIDLAFGKERLFEVLGSENGLEEKLEYASGCMEE